MNVRDQLADARALTEAVRNVDNDGFARVWHAMTEDEQLAATYAVCRLLVKAEPEVVMP